jgi:hypothetical protein
MDALCKQAAEPGTPNPSSKQQPLADPQAVDPARFARHGNISWQQCVPQACHKKGSAITADKRSGQIRGAYYDMPTAWQCQMCQLSAVVGTRVLVTMCIKHYLPAGLFYPVSYYTYVS